jgi:hypothetical protein
MPEPHDGVEVLAQDRQRGGRTSACIPAESGGTNVDGRSGRRDLHPSHHEGLEPAGREPTRNE